jgi:hypothetical protein
VSKNCAGLSVGKTPPCLLECGPCHKGEGWGLRQDPNYRNESNECGAFRVAFGLLPGEWFVSNEPHHGASFVDACDFQDCCYGWCRSGRDFCDARYYVMMGEACDAAFSGLLVGGTRASCRRTATARYNKARNDGGVEYERRQNEACALCCCPDSIIPGNIGEPIEP